MFGAGAGAPHEEGGMASGTLNMFREAGGTLGASITGTVLTSNLRSATHCILRS
jgi:hypothetical protein